MQRWYFLLAFVVSSFAFAEGPGPVGGHGTMRLGLDAGYHETLGACTGLSYRFGFHDFLDRQNEYPEHTQLDIASVRAEVFSGNKTAYFDELVALRFVRLPPLTSKWEELSWKVEAGARSVREPLCNRCTAGNLLAGLGATVEPIPGVSAWLLLEGEILGSPSFTGFPVKPSIGPRGGLRFRLRPWLNGMVYGVYRYQFAPGASDIFQFVAEGRVSVATNWALNARLQRLSDGWQASTALYAYF